MLIPYSVQERRMHDSIYFLVAQSLANPTLKVRILQYATNEIINELTTISDSLNVKFKADGLREDQLKLMDLCKTTEEFLVKLIMNCGFQEYRGKK